MHTTNKLSFITHQDAMNFKKSLAKYFNIETARSRSDPLSPKVERILSSVNRIPKGKYSSTNESISMAI